MNKKSHSFLKSILVLAIIVGGGFYIADKYFLKPAIDEKEVQNIWEQDHDYKYFYEQMNKEEQKIYEYLFYTVKTHHEKITIDDTDVDQIEDIFNQVLYDHPELYYVNGQFRYTQLSEAVIFVPEYDYSIEEVEQYNRQIEEKIQPVITTIKQESTAKEQAKAAYDYVIENNEYQENEKTDQNVISSLLEGKTVCAGYARAYQYILNKLGIDCTYIVGKANEDNMQTQTGEGHAWTMLKLDDVFYYCDPTWGDVVESELAHICYGYFMMDSTDMLACYEPEVKYEITKDNADNYFKDEALYMEKYDETIMSKAIQKGLKNKTRVAEIKCGNQNVYNKVKSKLENSYLGYDLLTENGCWSESTSYSCDDRLKLVELYF